MPITITFVTYGNTLVSKRKSDWHPEEIKAAVRMSGVTLTALAKREGLSESACRSALIRRTGRADVVIAEQIGKSLSEIWPSRYATRHEREQHTRSHSRAHRLTDVAA